jgi:hypothetical protein
MTELTGITPYQDQGITAAQARRIFVLRRGERRIVRCGRRVDRIRRFFFCAPVKFWWSSADGAGTEKPLFLSAEDGASGGRLSGEFAEIR